MCGIAGFHLKERACPAWFNHEEFVDALLLGIEHRGRDSTGFVAVNKEGKGVTLDKRPMPASHFVLQRNAIPHAARTVLLHTRLGTQGSEQNPANNHPVVHKTTFVTHNGMIQNDTELFRQFNLNRTAQVDSEIIAALFAEFGLDEVEAVSEELRGSFAYAAINPINNPDQLILAKGHTSPLIVLDHPKMIVWASEKDAIELAWGMAIGTPPSDGKYRSLNPGEILIINGDEITERKFTTAFSTNYGIACGWDDWYDGMDDEDDGSITSWRDARSVRDPHTNENWIRQKDGSWKRILDDGTIEIIFPTKKDDRSLHAKLGNDTNEMCWICRNRLAIATLIDGANGATWEVPVCLPCLREETDSSFEPDESTERCSDCNRGATELEMQRGWQEGLDGRRLCVRCNRAERRHTNVAPISQNIQQCDHCKVFKDAEQVTNTWWGKCCDKCIANLDRGAYCAECRDWTPLDKVKSGADEKLRCFDCHTLYLESINEDKAIREQDTELKRYEEMAEKSQGLFLTLCQKVAWELNMTTEFVDWILVLCPKAQFRHDKTLKDLYKRAQASYDRHLKEMKKEMAKK